MTLIYTILLPGPHLLQNLKFIQYSSKFKLFSAFSPEIILKYRWVYARTVKNWKYILTHKEMEGDTVLKLYVRIKILYIFLDKSKILWGVPLMMIIVLSYLSPWQGWPPPDCPPGPTRTRSRTLASASTSEPVNEKKRLSVVKLDHPHQNIRQKHPVSSSVTDPDPGSGAFLTRGSGIRNPEQVFSESRIPNPFFWELSDNFLGKKFYNSLKIGPHFFLQHFKTKIMFNFVKFVAT